MAHPALPVRPRNDPAQYDDLADQWWPSHGAFAALRWLAAARAELIPPAPHRGAVLLDVACGGGLLAPYVTGYRHIGVDQSPSAVRVAREHGVQAVRGLVTALPVADAAADVVVAGEILEHVPDLESVVGELARVLRPGGTLVLDTIADTAFARLVMVHVAERLPGGPPPRIHDPALFVSPRRLADACGRHGIRLRFRGLRPSITGYLLWLARRRDSVAMQPVRATNAVYQAVGVKAA